MTTDPTITTIDESSSSSLLNRRRFIAGISVAGAAIALGACGGDDDEGSGSSSSSTEAEGTTEADTTTTASDDTTTTASDDTTTTASDDTTTTTDGSGGAEADTQIAMLAAGLEVLAVDTYAAAASAATGGDLGDVPPAIVNYVTTAMSHHQAHLDVWNGILTSGGGEAVTEPNAQLKPTVDDALGQVTDVTAAAELALMLEDIAAATYLDAVSKLTNTDAIGQAGSMQIIDMQHAAILNFVLGQYPVPEVFASTDKSAAA